MIITETKIPDVKIIEPKVFSDSRGYFFESYNMKRFKELVGNYDFIQDNEAKSTRGVLRGLHFQIPPFAQAKLVRVIEGEVLDVVVDMRKTAPTFGQSVSINLSAKDKRQLFVPKGFAHAYIVLSDTAIFAYKVDNAYSPRHEQGVIYNDQTLNIDWQLPESDIILSEKDKLLLEFKDAFYFE